MPYFDKNKFIGIKSGLELIYCGRLLWKVQCLSVKKFDSTGNRNNVKLDNDGTKREMEHCSAFTDYGVLGIVGGGMFPPVVEGVLVEFVLGHCDCGGFDLRCLSGSNALEDG